MTKYFQPEVDMAAAKDFIALVRGGDLVSNRHEIIDCGCYLGGGVNAYIAQFGEPSVQLEKAGNVQALSAEGATLESVVEQLDAEISNNNEAKSFGLNPLVMFLIQKALELALKKLMPAN